MKLREINNTRQESGELRRRWFSGEEMDLYVWLNDEEVIVAYQLTYDKPHSEKAVVWKEEEGISHLGVDDGSNPGGHPGSPLLVPDGKMNGTRIIAKLKEHGSDLDSEITGFIISSIQSQLK